MESKNYLSITDFTRILKINLEGVFTELYLRGEISNFRPSTTGHWFFSLKDNNASIKAVIFKGSQQYILSDLKKGDYLKNGQEVLVEGKISLYEKSGEYSIIVNKIIPVGIGELTLKFELLKEKLLKEGLFEQSIKKPLPKYPISIGIVTAPTGAALQDMLNVLKRRFTSIRIIVFPASVQGDEAKYEIAKAIKCANYHYEKNTDKKVDVLIVGRGGGSIEDLWAFNEEVVAYSIYNSKIPIITGIGHEIDFTIADFCADLRAPTPSAAAEIVVKNSEDLLNSIASSRLRMEVSFSNKYEKIITKFKNSEKNRLIQLLDKIYSNNFQNHLYLNEKFNNIFKEKYTKLKQSFSLLTGKLDNLSPLSILSRGYSIVIDKTGNVVKKSITVNKGDDLKVVLSEGELDVKVI